jgi:hypothetical protein
MPVARHDHALRNEETFMGSAYPASVRHYVPDPIVPPSAELQWSDTASPSALRLSPAVHAHQAGDAADLIDLQYQAARARLELEALFGEGLIGP